MNEKSNINVQERILELLGKVKREGMPQLIEWIKKSDFFTAPASSEHHLAIRGGLAIHSLNVYNALKGVSAKYTPDITEESVIITGLLHDLCKANFYKPDFRNKKIDGKWERVPYFAIEDQDPYGHGEKSVIIIQKFIKLEDHEILAIRYHMGAWAAEGFAQIKSLGAAIDKCKFLRATMLADQVATYFMEDK